MFLMILGASAFQLRSKIKKKSVQGRSKIKAQIGPQPDPIFDGSWTPFFPNFPSKLEGRDTQNH